MLSSMILQGCFIMMSDGVLKFELDLTNWCGILEIMLQWCSVLMQFFVYSICIVMHIVEMCLFFNQN